MDIQSQAASLGFLPLLLIQGIPLLHITELLCRIVALCQLELYCLHRRGSPLTPFIIGRHQEIRRHFRAKGDDSALRRTIRHRTILQRHHAELTVAKLQHDARQRLHAAGRTGPDQRDRVRVCHAVFQIIRLICVRGVL